MSAVHPLAEELIGTLTANDTFTRAEAVALLGSISAQDGESLADNVERVVAWARRVRTEHEILATILTLGAHGAVEVRPSAGGDGVTMRPLFDPNECEIDP
jgi:hypothetical protein